MEKGTTTKCNFLLNLSLLVLLSCLGTTQSADIDSVRCNFTVKYHTTPGRCSVNGKTLLQIDIKDQDTPLCKPRKEETATDECPLLTQSLKDILEEMRKQESQLFKTKGDHLLQVAIQSQCNQGQLMDGFWAFAIDGQHPFYFYPINGTWRVNHPDAGQTMNKWQANRDLAQGLWKLSMGDFSHCLKKLLPHSRELPKTTTKSPDTTQLTSATQIRPTLNKKPPTSASQRPNTTWILFIVVGIGVILF